MSNDLICWHKSNASQKVREFSAWDTSNDVTCWHINDVNQKLDLLLIHAVHVIFLIDSIG